MGSGDTGGCGANFRWPGFTTRTVRVTGTGTGTIERGVKQVYGATGIVKTIAFDFCNRFAHRTNDGEWDTIRAVNNSRPHFIDDTVDDLLSSPSRK